MTDKDYLQVAVDLANTSDEPVKCAAVLVDPDGQIVAKAYNSQRTDGLTASHAEMKAIAAANKLLGRKLTGLTAYGNCEPCTMCLTALIFAGVNRIVFANRLNDMVPKDKQITIDCFSFVKQFPYQPLIEQVEI